MKSHTAVQMISQYHKNRRPHNWLIYNVCDRSLEKHSRFYRGTLYDLGAGESPYKKFFLQYAEKYIAVDWADSYHNTKADIIADLNEPLPINDAVADSVVSLSVLEHLHEPQIMIKEAYRILKSGGRFVAQVPWQWCIHEAPYDFFRYTPYGLNYLMRNAGFVDIHIEPQAGFFTMIVLKINYFSLRLILGPRPLRWILAGIFSTFWYVGQNLAPLLDKLDRNWELDASGYFVTARKF